MFPEIVLLLLLHGPFFLLYMIFVIAWCVFMCPCILKLLGCKTCSTPQIIINAAMNMFGFRNQEYYTKGKTILFGFEAPDFFIRHLFCFAVFVILFALALFWKNYILEDVPCVKGSSNIIICCYAFSCNLNNCSHYLNDETDFNTDYNNSLNCYKLSFSFGNAFSSSAGFFASFTFIITLMTIVFLGVSGGSNGSRNRWCFTILLQVLYFSFVLAFFAVHLTAFNMSIAATFSYNQILSIFWAYFASFYLNLFVLLIPWCKFKKIQEGQSHEDVERQTTEHTRLIQAT